MGEVCGRTAEAGASGSVDKLEVRALSPIAGRAAEAIAAAIPAYEGDERPIGIFDSGLGGLTVARCIAQALPHESICYIGDTERCPYGVRSEAEVRSFVLQVGSWLTRQNVKMIIIACNTATAAALQLAQQTFDVPVIGVIVPGARAAIHSTRTRKVGVLATPLMGWVWRRVRRPVPVVWALVACVFAVNAYIAFVSPGDEVRGLLEWRKLMSAVSYLVSFLAGGALGELRRSGSSLFSGRLPRHHAGAAFFYWADCLPFYYICVSLRHHTRSCIQRSRLRVVGVDVFGDRLADIAQGYLTLGFFLKSNDVSSHFFFPVMAMTNRNMRLSYTFF